LPSEISSYFILVTDTKVTVSNMHKGVAPPILRLHASTTLRLEREPHSHVE